MRGRPRERKNEKKTETSEKSIYELNIEIPYRDTLFMEACPPTLDDQLVANGRALQLDEVVVAAICSDQHTRVLESEVS